jgi:hypothetical protein
MSTNADDIEVEIVEDAAPEVELEIVDDTPEKDRDRKNLSPELVAEIEDDDLSDYSKKVKTRLSQLKKVWHDERRAKESADRERAEAVKYASSMHEENKRLKANLNNGEQAYMESVKQAVGGEMDAAKRDYREAYDSGDADKLIEAQQRMNSAQYKLTQAQNYVPQYEKALQAEENSVNVKLTQPQSAGPDHKALVWREKNDWFGQDEEMTSLALGLHEKLVRSGMDPTSKEYYTRIDETMRKRFPENFGDDSLDEDSPTQRKKPSNVVASATRSTAPKKVHLSASQLSLARKLGITPEHYARETLTLEKKNG